MILKQNVAMALLFGSPLSTPSLRLFVHDSI